MTFKIYKNRKTRHPSISIKQNNPCAWHNMPITHSRPKHKSSLEISDPHPLAKPNAKSYVRCYVRKDKKKIKGHPYKEYVLSKESETKIKNYLKSKYKKR